MECGVEKGELEQCEEGTVRIRHGRAGPRRRGGAGGSAAGGGRVGHDVSAFG